MGKRHADSARRLGRQCAGAAAGGLRARLSRPRHHRRSAGRRSPRGIGRPRRRPRRRADQGLAARRRRFACALDDRHAGGRAPLRGPEHQDRGRAQHGRRDHESRHPWPAAGSRQRARLADLRRLRHQFRCGTVDRRRRRSDRDQSAEVRADGFDRGAPGLRSQGAVRGAGRCRRRSLRRTARRDPSGAEAGGRAGAHHCGFCKRHSEHRVGSRPREARGRQRNLRRRAGAAEARGLRTRAQRQARGFRELDAAASLRHQDRAPDPRRGCPFAPAHLRTYRASPADQVTGDRNRVLLVHALNAKGQPLASSMKMSGDLLLGSGFAGRIDYNGTIAALEIVFAAEEQTAEFPFALTDFSFAGEKRPVARDDAPDFQPLSPQALHAQYPKPLPPPEKPEPRLATSEVAPFEISLDRAQAFFQLGLTVGVRGPDAPGFRRRFDLGQLQLTRVSLKDGTALSPPEPGKADRSVWSAPLRFTSSPKQGVLSAPLSFSVDTKAKPQDLKSVEGKLTLRFPRAIDTVRLDDLGVGQTVQSGGIKGTIAARSRQGVTIETSADAERVVYVRLLDAQGQALMFGSPTIAALPDGGTRIDLSPFDPPARAEVVIARELETETLPFSLTLP